jgi:hypothetical protein
MVPVGQRREEERMAKRAKKTTELAEISPKDLAKALQGVSRWVNAIRRVVLKLDKDCTVTVRVPVEGSKRRPQVEGCPPPE